MFQKIILFCLQKLARKIIHKHSPIVIGITGSMGKTSVRDFLAQALQSKNADFYTPEGNYNGEYGLPLSIMQARSGGRSIPKWIHAFVVGLKQLLRKDYPQILILEYGIDRPDEMSFMCDIVEPHIAIFTTLSPSHVMNFTDNQEYFAEKKKLARNYSGKTQHIIINSDDRNQSDILATESYGISPLSSKRITNVSTNTQGIVFTLDGQKNQTHLLGEHNIYTLSPVIITLEKMGYNLKDISEIIQHISLPHGRGNILQGIQDSIILDGTYNGGFEPTMAGVSMLEKFSQGTHQSVAIVGDMRELGDIQQERHEELGVQIQKCNIDHIIFVGPMLQEYLQDNLTDDRYIFTLDSREAGKITQKLIESSQKKTIVFAKGSQNTIFLEEALKPLVITEDFSKLVRQTCDWMNTKQAFFDTL